MKYTYHNTLEEKVVHTMVGTLIVLALVYIVVLMSLVFSVIERKQNIIATKNLSSDIASLEASYSNKVSMITDGVLADHSFTRIKNTTFAVRKDDIASYAFLYGR